MSSDRKNTFGHGLACLVGAGLLLLVTGCATRARVAQAAAACDPCAPTTAAEPVGDRPPEAKAGEAWCRVWIPPVTETISETVCVKPAQKRCVEIPARYGTRPKVVCVSEAKLSERVQPAVYGARKRQVMVCPPAEGWQRVECPPGQLGPCEQQCECYAKVERPAQYCEVEERVCISPERRCVDYTPAQYKVVEETFVIDPARTQEICEPAVYETRCREVVTRPGRWEWRRNTDCEVPEACPPPMPAPKPEALPALQVEMIDSDESGSPAGVFAVGDIVRYDLVISSDEGATAISGLTVHFSLPAELVYVSGGGPGITVSGAGQAAQTSGFNLAVGQERTMYVLCRVVGVPATNLAQLTASVRDMTGFELATETESTTLKPAAR